jgi:hypothetical protein
VNSSAVNKTYIHVSQCDQNIFSNISVTVISVTSMAITISFHYDNETQAKRLQSRSAEYVLGQEYYYIINIIINNRCVNVQKNVYGLRVYPVC